MAEPLPDLSSAALRQLVGRRIRQLRRQKNLTQYQLAKRAKIAPNTLRGIETGAKHTQFAKLVLVARSLNTSVGVLMHAIEGEPDVWANPLLRELRTEDLQMAQQYHHASTPVRTAVRRFLANPDVSRGLLRQHLTQASYTRYMELSPSLREHVDLLIEYLHRFMVLETKNSSQHSA